MQTGDDRDRWRNDARCIARGHGARRRGFAEQAGQTRRAAGDNAQDRAFAADDTAVDPRHVALDAKLVDELPRLEVVGPIEDNVGAGETFLGVARDEIGHERLDGDLGIYARQMPRGGFGFREPILEIVFGVQKLALQVGPLDFVAVNQAQTTDAGARQHIGLERSQGPATHNDRLRRADAPLALFTNGSK